MAFRHLGGVFMDYRWFRNSKVLLLSPLLILLILAISCGGQPAATAPAAAPAATTAPAAAAPADILPLQRPYLLPRAQLPVRRLRTYPSLRLQPHRSRSLPRQVKLAAYSELRSLGSQRRLSLLTSTGRPSFSSVDLGACLSSLTPRPRTPST